MSPLTRAEAETRARLLTVHSYAIDLDLTRGDELFGSTTRIRFTTDRPGTATTVQLKPALLRRAELNGRPLDPATLRDDELPLPDLAADNELLVEADMRYSRTGEGLHRFTDPADGETYTYSQGFLEDAQRMYACFDQPDLKATFDLTVTAPAGWTVLGNAVGTHHGDGRWTFATTPPISTYLFAVAAGPYHSIRTEHAGLPFGLHCRRSLAPHLDADADELFDITRRAFDHYAAIFDEPYPFDSYDQAFVPEFNAGAMENPGLVTFRDEFVFRAAVTDSERRTRGMVVTHEMAHMWFGDLVTLRWWDDIWLNESFAEYMGYQTLADISRAHPGPAEGWLTGDAWVDFGIVRKAWGYDADQRPSTHPVAPAADVDTRSAMSNFDGISYAKGASAIRQLVTWLGPKTFLAGVNDHITRNRFGNATLADFTDSLSRAAGDRDVRGWADSWLRTTGPDTLTVTTATTPDDRWTLRVERDGHRPHRLAVGRYDHDPDRPGALLRRPPVDVTVPDGPELSFEGPRPALLLPNDGDLTYAKIRLDDDSWDTVTTSLGGVPDALSRSLLWNAARDLVRDALLPPEDHLALVVGHLPAETDVCVIEAVLRFARHTLTDTYLHPDRRPAALQALATVSRALLDRTPADHAVRLAALRTLIDSTTPGDGVLELTGQLDAGRAHGIPLDPQLRWRALARLSALGAADPDRIAAELHRDPSSAGHESAAQCRAALPDPDAKRAAWQALFEDDSLSNNLASRTAAGFWQPEQHDLLTPYLTPWFDAAAAVSARRGTAIATAVTRDGFPAHAVDDDLLATGRRCLDRDDLHPAFRRGLADQLDDLRRAVAIRAPR